MMKTMTASFESKHVLSPLQEQILAIYKEVKKIIDRHNLRAFAIGGTCIGAVRHQGFIPWDDDLDIALPDVDYNRFLQYAPAELPPHLKLARCEDRPHNAALSTKVFDVNTTFIESYETPYPDEYKGVFIDIFLLSGTPEDEAERENYFKKFLRYTRLNEKRRLRPSMLDRTRSKAMWWAVLPLRLLPYRFWSDRLNRLIAKYPYDSHTYISHAWNPYSKHFLLRRDEVYGTPKELPFEDTTMPCVEDCDTFLTAIFGDYMQLPPESERHGIHSGNGVIDLNRPYTYYQQQFRKTGTLKKDKV